MSGDEPQNAAPQRPASLAAAEREARRAAALRANLRRRKAQQRAREAGDEPHPAAPAPRDDEDAAR